MPTYEYQCQQCFHTLEAFQKISDPALVTCPACGADALEKQLSATAFSLKGSGWYVTDFRDKGAKKTESETPTEKSTETTKQEDNKPVSNEPTTTETRTEKSTSQTNPEDKGSA